MKLIVVALTALFFFGCGTGPCHEHQAQAAQSEASLKASKSIDRVRVYKPDGSKQCETGPGVSPETMKKELGDIQVFSATNKADGLMHVQMCGAATGKCNVYEINKSDLDKAKKAGFKEWTWD